MPSILSMKPGCGDQWLGLSQGQQIIQSVDWVSLCCVDFWQGPCASSPPWRASVQQFLAWRLSLSFELLFLGFCWTKTPLVPSFSLCPSFVFSLITVLPVLLPYWWMRDLCLTHEHQMHSSLLRSCFVRNTGIDWSSAHLGFYHLLAEIHWASTGCLGSAGCWDCKD